VIKATAIILQRRKLVQEQADVLVASLVDAANKLEEKVMLVLEASGQSDRRRALEKVDLAKLTNEIAKSLERTDEPRRVLFESGMSTPAVITDPEAMTVILKCIVDNALKFSPPEKPVKVAVRDHDGEVAITVEDQGPGVPEEFADEAFEAFTQADASLSRAAGGLGIGLYAAHRLAGSIGARLNLSSTDEGTRLTISVPQRRDIDE
jgi:signal transduction histidine kinase